MIDEDDLPQAILNYASRKYDRQIEGLCEKYVEEFPEKDCDLPDEDWQKNFLCWLIYEKVLPQTGKTIAEEFIEQSPEVSPEMKKNALLMRNMIRSKFEIISEKGVLMQFKDSHTKKIYPVKRHKNGPKYPVNTVVTGRIFPFGDHYRTTGFFFLQTDPFLFNINMFMDAYDTEQLNVVEGIILRSRSSFASVMNKYPMHWINWMCQQYQITQRLKKDKVRAIEQKVRSDLSTIYHDLPKKSREVLHLCMNNGGVVKYRLLHRYDDDLRFLWEDHPVSSPIGVLRQKGLLFIGTMWLGQRKYKVAFIPVEFRNALEDLVHMDCEQQNDSMGREMKKEKEETCPLCKKRSGKRSCPEVHQSICASCCGQKRSEIKCTNKNCPYGFEKIWIEKQEHRTVEHQVSWSPTKEDIQAEMQGVLLAWCDRSLAILDGRTPREVAKTPEGKKQLIALLQSIENDAKKTKRPGADLVDYTIIKRELGLL
jgi:hypothetical protein